MKLKHSTPSHPLTMHLPRLRRRLPSSNHMISRGSTDSQVNEISNENEMELISMLMEIAENSYDV